MNLVGKILIVLILLMSLTFMGFAVSVYSTHQSWLDAVNNPQNGYKVKLAAMTLSRDQKEAQIKELDERRKAEVAARQDKLTSAETERNQLRAEHDALKNEYATLVQQARASVATMETVQQTLKDMRTEVNGLRKNIHESQQDRDEKFKEVVKLTDDLNQSQSELKRLKAQSAVLSEQIARHRAIAGRVGLNLNSDPESHVIKADGIVEASNPKDGLVEISLGSDDGVKPGTLLTVKRDARYIGRIEIVKTDPEKSVARVLKEFRKAQIERNDVVTTPID